MSELSVVLVEGKEWKPFVREVFTASPEPGYKYELVVEKTCTSSEDARWKLVFDLYRKDASGTFHQIVHVSFKPLQPDEQRGVQALATRRLSAETTRLLRKEVHPCAKDVAASANPTPEHHKFLRDAMSKVARAAVDI